MDVLFDAVERLSESLRRRWPGAVLGVGLTLWLLVTVAFGWAATVATGGPVTGIVLATPPAVLLSVTALRGIDRLPWPVWPLGVLLPVALAGIVAPQAPDFEPPFDLLAPVLLFVYTQIFLSTVAAADEVYRRRTAGPGRMGPVGRRRLLQTRILVATLVVLGSTWVRSDPGLTADVGNVNGAQGFGYAFGCLSLPMFVGVWLRRHGLAWYAVAVLPTVFALSLVPRNPDGRWQALLAQGWIVFAATWWWGRAAVQPFWKWPPPPLHPRAT
jgi:hypothetical protein